MTDKTPPAKPVAPPEFYDDVNGFIDKANLIEKRLDSHHAQLALMHGFARYAAHHYCLTAKIDNPAQRQSFATYISTGVTELVMQNLTQMAGPIPPVVAAKDKSAG